MAHADLQQIGSLLSELIEGPHSDTAEASQQQQQQPTLSATEIASLPEDDERHAVAEGRASLCELRTLDILRLLAETASGDAAAATFMLDCGLPDAAALLLQPGAPSPRLAELLWQLLRAASAAASTPGRPASADPRLATAPLAESALSTMESPDPHTLAACLWCIVGWVQPIPGGALPYFTQVFAENPGAVGFLKGLLLLPDPTPSKGEGGAHGAAMLLKAAALHLLVQLVMDSQECRAALVSGDEEEEEGAERGRGGVEVVAQLRCLGGAAVVCLVEGDFEDGGELRGPAMGEEAGGVAALVVEGSIQLLQLMSQMSAVCKGMAEGAGAAADELCRRLSEKAGSFESDGW